MVLSPQVQVSLLNCMLQGIVLLESNSNAVRTQSVSEYQVSLYTYATAVQGTKACKRCHLFTPPAHGARLRLLNAGRSGLGVLMATAVKRWLTWCGSLSFHFCGTTLLLNSNIYGIVTNYSSFFMSKSLRSDVTMPSMTEQFSCVKTCCSGVGCPTQLELAVFVLLKDPSIPTHLPEGLTRELGQSSKLQLMAATGCL